MKNLSRLLQVLEQTAPDGVFNYVVPDVWTLGWDASAVTRATPWGQMLVNPWRYHAALIREHILPRASSGLDQGGSLSQIRARTPDASKPCALASPAGKGGDWIRRASVYSTLIRTSTAWDHDRSGELEDANLYGLKETGTFVKMIGLLPLLQYLGVDTVYMLPISKFSRKDHKGDLGSPYGVSNFLEIDPDLKDPMTGDHLTVEEEFAAFVEACHVLGLRVMIDIIPRTNSVNSDLIADHPDWFYWIRHEDLASYRPPRVPGLGDTVVPKPEFLPAIYSAPEVWAHIGRFVHDPRQQDPARWRAMVKAWRTQGGFLLDHVRETFGLTVAPAFSDHINDVQPAWSDVTFFRLFLDHPKAARPWLGEAAAHLPPYILFDTIKADLYEGEVPNLPLWETLADIIPHYQRQFGIDGARIDMGHALPRRLVEQIMRKARALDPDFCFVAEELYPERAPMARDLGYNLIIGQGFFMQPRLAEFKAHEFYYDSAKLALPVFAGGETHDTPRLAARTGGRDLSRLVTVLNLFTPNGVPFLNSGQEVWEVQPMNLGLDCTEEELRRLPPEDPGHGKLALFDRVALHYLNPGRRELITLIHQAAALRQRYLDWLTDPAAFVGLGFASMRTPAIGLGYFKAPPTGDAERMLLVIAHTDLQASHRLFIDLRALRAAAGHDARSGRLLLSTHDVERAVTEFDDAGNLWLDFAPGEVKVIVL